MSIAPFSIRKQCFRNWLSCCSAEGSRRHLFTSFFSVDWNQYEPHTFLSEEENRMFARKLGSVLNIRHWTNSRNPLILNVSCRHQNALGLTEFCYWGDKNSIYGKKIKDLSGKYKSDTFFSHIRTGDGQVRLPLELRCFSSKMFCQKVVTKRLLLLKVKVTLDI